MSTTDAHDLVELAATSVARFADRPLFGERVDGSWRWTSYAAWQRRVDGARAGLAALGVGPGDRVAIVSRNGVGWATAAYASFGLGAAFVPMYEQQRPDDWEHILGDSGASVVFARTPEIATALVGMQARLPALRHVITMEPPTGGGLAAFEQSGAPVATHPAQPDDVAALVYTSGTTGRPKGVMLTHRNLTTNVIATLAAFPIGPGDRTVSFLPWSHVYGQVCELHILVAAGASTAFNTRVEDLVRDLAEVRPTMLVAVPRIFNKIHAGVTAQIEQRPRLIRALFRRGLAASVRRKHGERLHLGERVLCWLAGFLFAAIRRKFGGRLRYAISGSATLSHEVADFVDGIGIAVYEGYGLTETSPIVAFNRPGCRRIGSVGVPIEGVTIEIDRSRGIEPAEGEIVVHGPNVMKGYHARPDENARAFTVDGGLRTGDLGYVDGDGFLFITGRIKDQYKLENGKYVMPGPLEEQLALSPFIRNVVLFGANHPYNVALVAIEPDRVRAWARDRGFSPDDATRDPRVVDLIRDELARLSAHFRAFEKPHDCALTEMPFTIENGLLTPTLKVKRREVEERFGGLLERLYERPAHAPTPAPPSVGARVAGAC
jgi:long-chain acyl-CoA synthetase